MDESLITINAETAIPQEEITWQFSRSGGPGGQNVNKTATRVELLFDVDGSPSLSDIQRQRIHARLGRYIDGAGILRLASQATASQWQNRRDALERFRGLMAFALQPFHARVHTRTPHKERIKRLEEKRRHSQKKQGRRTASRAEW